MKNSLKLLIAFCAILLVGCGGKEENKKEPFTLKKQTNTENKVEANKNTKPSEIIDLTNKGIGPIKSLELPAEIDQAMAATGEEVYKRMCTACHRPDKKFIGPAPLGVLERRTPEWIMNMILNPEEMLKDDPLAKALFVEFNGAPMANQNLTQEEARAILEYFRTLK